MPTSRSSVFSKIATRPFMPSNRWNIHQYIANTNGGHDMYERRLSNTGPCLTYIYIYIYINQLANMYASTKR